MFSGFLSLLFLFVLIGKQIKMDVSLLVVESKASGRLNASFYLLIYVFQLLNQLYKN